MARSSPFDRDDSPAGPRLQAAGAVLVELEDAYHTLSAETETDAPPSKLAALVDKLRSPLQDAHQYALGRDTPPQSRLEASRTASTYLHANPARVYPVRDKIRSVQEQAVEIQIVAPSMSLQPSTKEVLRGSALRLIGGCATVTALLSACKRDLPGYEEPATAVRTQLLDSRQGDRITLAFETGQRTVEVRNRTLRDSGTIIECVEQGDGWITPIQVTIPSNGKRPTASAEDDQRSLGPIQWVG